jgi:hypothetical protein|tara:strand:- start:109 stop:579 length:471 start_codon:yes stop_codon:yes gene_type:complete
MRLRAPPITGEPVLDGFLKDVYQMGIQILVPAGGWEQTNVTASQTSVALNLIGSSTNTEITFPYKGNVSGISVASNAARSAGTLTVVPVINSTASTTLSAVLNGTNTTYASGVQVHENDPFLINQAVGVEITTDSSWAPITADIVVTLFIRPGSVD